MQQGASVTAVARSLFTPFVDAEALRAWRVGVASRAFAVTALLQRRHPELPWAAAETLWSLPADERAAQLHEPLVSYAHHLLSTATGGSAGAQRKQILAAMQLIGSVVIGNAICRRVRRAKAIVDVDRFGRIRLPNCEFAVHVGRSHASEQVSISVDDGAVVVVRVEGGATVSHEVVQSRRGPRWLPGGLLVSSHAAYRRIGRTTIERNRLIVEELGRAGDRATTVTGGPFPMGAEVLRRLGTAAQVMVDAAPEWLAASRTFAPVVVPIATPYAVGFSVDKCRGAVFLAPERDPLATVDHYVHEAAHNRLDTAMELRPLFDPSEGRLFTSPWRLDPRPFSGLIHGIYSFAIAARVLAELPASGDGAARDPRRATVLGYCAQVEQAIDTVATGGVSLTAEGDGFVEGAADCLAATRRMVGSS